MGYVHLTDISKFISPFVCGKSAGTWTPTVATDLVTDVRTAADAEFDILIPIFLPGANSALQGAKLVSIDVWYIIATAAADGFGTVEIDKVTLPADDVAPTDTNPTVTLDTAHGTSGARAAVDEHKMTVTLSTPEFIEDDEAWYLHLSVDAAAATVFSLVGAQANFTLRL